MLRYLRPAGGSLAAASLATAGAYFVAAITADHTAPWWPYLLLLGLAVLGGIGYVAGQPDSDPREPATTPAVPEPQPPSVTEADEYVVMGSADMPLATEAAKPPPGPVITDRWHHTSDGARVPALMSMTHTSVTHRAYMERSAQDAPPSVKIGVLVACQPLGQASSGTELRAKFADFLSCPAMAQLLAALTDVRPAMSWKNLAGNGPRALEAALTADENPVEGVPAASALFVPPAPGESLYGRNGRAATLIVYIEPRTTDDHIPPPSRLAAWDERFRLALALPQAFAHFLATDLGLATSDDPPAQLGIWLHSTRPLTRMVDTDGLRILPGSWPQNQFIGWAVTAPDGDPAAQTARDLLIQLCEYTLHLDAYEQALAKIDV
jgi:hypothetical protein